MFQLHFKLLLTSTSELFPESFFSFHSKKVPKADVALIQFDDANKLLTNRNQA